MLIFKLFMFLSKTIFKLSNSDMFNE